MKRTVFFSISNKIYFLLFMFPHFLFFVSLLISFSASFSTLFFFMSSSLSSSSFRLPPSQCPLILFILLLLLLLLLLLISLISSGFSTNSFKCRFFLLCFVPILLKLKKSCRFCCCCRCRTSETKLSLVLKLSQPHFGR